MDKIIKVQTLNAINISIWYIKVSRRNPFVKKLM